VKTVVVNLVDYSGEKKAIYFNNTEDDKRADKIESMKLEPGAWIVVDAVCSDEEKGTATGLRAKYKGRWVLKDENSSATNILIGIATRPKELKGGAYTVTMPVDEYEDSQKKTVWYDVTFFNGEKDDPSAPGGKREWKNAEKARKVIAGSEKAFLCVLCGPMQEREVNGKKYKGFVGYSIQRKPE